MEIHLLLIEQLHGPTIVLDKEVYYWTKQSPCHIYKLGEGEDVELSLETQFWLPSEYCTSQHL